MLDLSLFGVCGLLGPMGWYRVQRLGKSMGVWGSYASGCRDLEVAVQGLGTKPHQLASVTCPWVRRGDLLPF